MYTLWERNWFWQNPPERALVLVGLAGFALIGGPILAFFYVTSKM